MTKISPPHASLAPYCVENIRTQDVGSVREIELTSSEYRQVLFLARGTGSVTLDGVTWKLAPGTFVVIPTGCLSVLRLRQRAHVFRIAAAEGFLRTKVLPALYMPPAEYWTTHHEPSVAGLWAGPGYAAKRRLILDELERARARLGLDCDGSVISYMYVILLAASRESQRSTLVSRQLERTPSMNLVMLFRELVHQKFRDQLRLAGYCKLLGVTPARLSRACRSLMACTPSSIIHERLLVEAKSELTYSAHSVSEIAYSLGFEDAAYFCRFFKQHIGHSPMEFRKLSGDVHAAAAEH
jgi:AraC family transcriptional activator of pobA